MNKRKLILSSSAANIFEWYDYALYGLFAQLIADKFFPVSQDDTPLLQAFAVFAAGYLMRPIGGIFFGVIGDRYGRKTALSAAIICMAFPTAIIGILPTYNTVGSLSTVLMITVRILQGLSMGGALTGSIAFIIEHTNPKRRGFIGSISMACICIGLLLGAVVTYIIKMILTTAQFNDWGWRIPFLLGIFIFFVGYYIRKSTEETPLFKKLKKAGSISKAPLREVVTKHWFDIIVSIFINSTGSVLFYLEAIFLITFLKNNRDFADSNIDLLNNIGYVIMAFATIIAGWFSDIIERKKIFVVLNLTILVIFNCGVINCLSTGGFVIVSLLQFVFALIAGAYIGPEPALQAEFYPTEIRNTALSISYNIAVSIFGGTAPYVLTLLVNKTDNISSVSYYISFCAILSLIGLSFYKDRSSRKIDE